MRRPTTPSYNIMHMRLSSQSSLYLAFRGKTMLDASAWDTRVLHIYTYNQVWSLSLNISLFDLFSYIRRWNFSLWCVWLRPRCMCLLWRYRPAYWRGRAVSSKEGYSKMSSKVYLLREIILTTMIPKDGTTLLEVRVFKARVTRFYEVLFSLMVVTLFFFFGGEAIRVI